MLTRVYYNNVMKVVGVSCSSDSFYSWCVGILPALLSSRTWSVLHLLSRVDVIASRIKHNEYGAIVVIDSVTVCSAHMVFRVFDSENLVDMHLLSVVDMVDFCKYSCK